MKNKLTSLMEKRVLIIAELSCNHQQNFELAVKSIEEIAKTGADAIKLQLYTPDTITLNSDNRHFRINSGTSWDGMTLYNLYKEAYTPWDWFPKLQKIAHKLGLFFFASAFDPTAVDFLEKLNVPGHKVASFEIHDLSLISKMAATKKPIFISTGIATKQDIETAVATCHKIGNHNITLMKCTSEYPTPLENVNLSVMPAMARDFETLVGLSDHTLGHVVPIAAVALGATSVEKHFILDRKLGGHDVAFSLDKNEFTELVQKIRDTEAIMGKPSYELTPKQKRSRKLGRSLFVVEDVKKGEVFTTKNVRSIRPASGLPPVEIDKVMGQTASKSIKRGTPLSRALIS